MVKARQSRTWFWFLFSFLLALILSILPLPLWAIWFRPAWLALLLIFWAIYLPHRYTLMCAWLSGIFLDLLQGTLLGQHALGLVLLVYLAEKLHRQFRMFSIGRQALTVAILVLINQFCLAVVQGMLGDIDKMLWLFWLPAVTSMLLWPWVSIVMRDYQRYFAIE